jgi:hypothetical protein
MNVHEARLWKVLELLRDGGAHFLSPEEIAAVAWGLAEIGRLRDRQADLQSRLADMRGVLADRPTGPELGA